MMKTEFLIYLVANARENPGSGHYFELRKYYLCLSEDKIKAESRTYCRHEHASVNAV